MEKEVESKVLEIGSRKSSIISKIEELGAKIKVNGILSAETVQNIMQTEIRIRETKNDDGTLEIHAEEKIITTEGDTKSANEIDREVGVDFESTLSLYKDKGFRELYSSIKRRTEYILIDKETQQEVKFAFDTYSEITGLNTGVTIPEFLEIEAGNKEMIYKYADMLSIPRTELLNWGPNELIAHYNNQ